MAVRTMRVRIAASDPPMVMAGKIRCATEPDPETGNSPSLMAKNKIKIGPRAKLGSDSQLQRPGISLKDHLGDRLIKTQRAAQIAMQNALPVIHILLPQREIKA